MTTHNALIPSNVAVTGNPELGSTVMVDGVRINLHDSKGPGEPILLLHGSGPGVSAWANWRLVIPELEKAGYRPIAPDIPGFGYSDPLPEFSMARWTEILIALLDQLGIGKVSVVGNSFGGALTLHLLVAAPERVRKAVTMGTAGGHFELTAGLDAVWGYEPSVDAMKALLDIFAFDRRLVTDELAQLRYAASIRPGTHESYRSLFPAPRQRWVDAMALTDSQLEAIETPVLLVHGRDDRVVPLEASLRIFSRLPNAQLHSFAQCGHWVQIEKNQEFVGLLAHYFGTDGHKETS